MTEEQQVIQRWKDSAPFWEKHRDAIRKMFHPVSEALAEEAKVSGAASVLDIATGSGEPALSLAAGAGTMIGIDLTPRMASSARQAGEARGVGNAFFAAANGGQLPFPEGTFNAAICRFGIMFIPSPVDAVREVLRVLKPAGTVAMAVWAAPERNPFFSAISDVLHQYAPSPPSPPDAMDGFRFAAPGKLAGIFQDAGVAEVTERVLQFAIEAPVSVEDFWRARYEMSDTLKEKVVKLSPTEQWPKIQEELFASLRQYAVPGGLSIPAEVLIVSGHKAN